jgi:hypothetical protein
MARGRTSEVSGEGGFSGGVGVGVGEGGTDLTVGCGDGVRVEVGEGGGRVAVGCGDGVRVGMGEGGTGVTVGCSDGLGVGEDGVVAWVGRERPVEQPGTRLIPVVVISSMRARHTRNRTQKDKLMGISEFGIDTP